MLIGLEQPALVSTIQVTHKRSLRTFCCNSHIGDQTRVLTGSDGHRVLAVVEQKFSLSFQIFCAEINGGRKPAPSNDNVDLQIRIGSNDVAAMFSLAGNDPGGPPALIMYQESNVLQRNCCRAI